MDPLMQTLTASLPTLTGTDAEIVRSMLDRARPYGRLTSNQARFASDILNRNNRQAAPALDLSRINTMFDTAAKAIKKPRVHFLAQGADFTVSPAPETGKNPGCLYVKAGSEYAGKISPEGRFSGARGAPEGILEALEAFAADPAAAVLAYGQATGNCCLCARPLTDPVSVERGIGPICAKRFGL